MNEILQHNFKTEKPVSIFTTTIVDSDMTTKIEEEIRKSGDKQDYKTNVKAYMTDWVMNDKPGFDMLTEKVKDEQGTVETLTRQLVQAGIRHNIDTGSKEVDKDVIETKAQQKFYRRLLDEDRKKNLQESKEKK